MVSAVAVRPSLTIVIEGLSILLGYGIQRETTPTTELLLSRRAGLHFMALLSANRTVATINCYLAGAQDRARIPQCNFPRYLS